MNYAKHVSVKVTPQSEAIPGEKQVQNNAGGFVYEVGEWDRLDRFLILGSEGGTYYVNEQKLTLDNAKAILSIIEKDGVRVVKRVVEISEAGRAPKNDPAIFVLALCAKKGNEATRKAAYAAVDKVCRIGTHLYHFAEFVKHLGGWGRGTRRAIGNWFLAEPAKVAYQVVKYQQRDGWSARDLLRKTHTVPVSQQHKDIFNWIVKGWEQIGPDAPTKESALQQIWAFEKLKRNPSVEEAVKLIKEFRLPHEAIPTELKNKAEIWEALLPSLGLEATIRNLANMTRYGLLTSTSEATKRVVERITSAEQIQKARVHPIKFLAAIKTYGNGRGQRGSNVWTPVQKIVDALDEGFYASFKAVEPTGKRRLLALDVSGSMSAGSVAGVEGLSPSEASAALAMVIMRTEKDYCIAGFTTGIRELPISPRMRLDEVVRKISNLTFGGTDCSLPMVWAKQKGLKFDSFEVFTDNETWAGAIHPSQALRQYRQASGIPAKQVVVGMTSTGFTIADPNDAGTLDVVGFDTAVPELIADFIKK